MSGTLSLPPAIRAFHRGQNPGPEGAVKQPQATQQEAQPAAELVYLWSPAPWSAGDFASRYLGFLV